MSQEFVWISFPTVIFLCTFATLFCVCTDLRAWCAVKHLQEMYWDFSFHFEKSSWNSFTLRFIGAQPFILQSAVFRLTRRKTDTNATPVQTTVLRFILFFFFFFWWDGQSSSFCKRRVIHLPSDLQKSLEAWALSFSRLLPDMRLHGHLGLDIIVIQSNHIDILIPYLHFIINSLSEPTWNTLHRRAVICRYAATPSYFPQALSCFDLTNRWIPPWLLTRVTFCCLFPSVSFVQAAYDDLRLYFQPSAFCRSWPRIRED